ncbi:MAG: ABC transporter substrate-binding protein [Anaerolineae bacterium]
MKRYVGLIVLLVVATACTALPSPPATPANTELPTKLTLWHAYGGSFGKEFEALVEGFNATHSDIVVEPSYGGNLYTMRDKLLTAIAGNAAPDVAQIDQFWSSELAQAGAIVRMEDFIDADPGIDKADILDKAWETATYSGDIWSMPFSLSNIALYYNKALFEQAGLDPEKPPATWEELVEVGQALTQDTDGDGAVDQWGLWFPLQINRGNVYYWFAFLWQAGGDIFDADFTRAEFNGPAGVEALQFWRDLVHKHGIVPLAPPEQGFEAGKIAMTFASTARLNRYLAALGSDRLGMAPMPGHTKHATGIGGANLAILSTAKDREAAWEFVKWMTSPETNLRWSMETGYLPLRQSVIQSDTYQAYLEKELRARTILEQMPDAVVRPNIPAYAPASREVGLTIEDVLFNDADPQAALDAAAAKANALLQQ